MKLRAAVLCLFLWNCGRPGQPLETFKTVPDFTLTASSGSPFHYSTQLKGRVWIADFIFTTCMGPCPRMSTQMRQVQAALSGMPQVKLVSFTVDPANDTPEALAAYAKRYAADPARWFFLTGPKEMLQMLSMDTFMLSKVDGQMDHSTRFVLVDQEGRVRKYYATSEGFQIHDLVLDVKRLLKAQRALAAPPAPRAIPDIGSRRAAPFYASSDERT
ncbi:MAG: SCO family protein [Acidobacteriia bacterium]|nr:SCO family protein [Terriglobia bacterium]